jgi:hypothetical protein
VSNNHYIDLFKEMGINRRDYVDRLWGTIKFITTITSIIAFSLSFFSICVGINIDNEEMG